MFLSVSNSLIHDQKDPVHSVHTDGRGPFFRLFFQSRAAVYQQKLLCFVAFSILTTSLIACDKKVEVKKAPVVPPVAPKTVAKQQAREVFGVPLPPRVRSMSRNPHYVWVETDMSINQLEKFYKSALKKKDFEIVRDRNTIHIIGLRPFMAVVRAAYIRGKRSNIRMVFKPSRTISDRANSPKANGAGKSVVSNTVIERRRKSRASAKEKKGSPVTLRTPSGELLAPKARWGEPYTPEKGTPLHNEAMKANFGKPFGEWAPH